MQLPNLDKSLTEKFKESLKNQAIAYKITLSIVTIGFPIIESILASIITASKDQNILLWIIFISVMFIHVLLFISTILPSEVLTEFLLEHDNLEKEKCNLSKQVELYQGEIEVEREFTSIFKSAIQTSELSLLSIQSYSKIEKSKKEFLAEVLEPWNKNRSTIFNFTEGRSRHNFAIYLLNSENELEVEARFCDDRIVRKDRKWKSGEGHVGRCFQEKKLIYSEDITKMSLTSDEKTRIEDKDYYKSFMAYPLRLNTEIIGVVVVTSDQTHHFIDEIHDVIIRCCLTRVIEVALLATTH